MRAGGLDKLQFNIPQVDRKFSFISTSIYDYNYTVRRFKIGQKIFMVVIPALHLGKAVVRVAPLQVAVNDLLEVRPPEPVRTFEPLLLDLYKGLKMVLHSPVIIRRFRVPGMVNGGRSR
jgi:hypothetical protein